MAMLLLLSLGFYLFSYLWRSSSRFLIVVCLVWMNSLGGWYAVGICCRGQQISEGIDVVDDVCGISSTNNDVVLSRRCFSPHKTYISASHTKMLRHHPTVFETKEFKSRYILRNIHFCFKGVIMHR